MGEPAGVEMPAIPRKALPGPVFSRFLCLLAPLFLLNACARFSSTPVEDAAAAEPPPPPPVTQIIGEPLVPEDLTGFVAIRGYSYGEEEGAVQITFTVENLTATETFLLEARSVYFDRRGEILSESSWTRFELQPGRRHHYFSQVPARGVAAGRSFLRRVVDRDYAGAPNDDGQ